MTNPPNSIASPWSASPTVKARNAVQRSVTALLDELAPERVLKRVEQLKGSVEQHRTPTGCVLQAATAAVTVSWFASGGSDTDLGELQVIVWNGTVTRRGSGRRGKGAAIVAEFALRPIEPPEGDRVWRGPDGARYDTAALAAKCIELLEQQIVTQNDAAEESTAEAPRPNEGL